MGTGTRKGWGGGEVPGWKITKVGAKLLTVTINKGGRNHSQQRLGQNVYNECHDMQGLPVCRASGIASAHLQLKSLLL